MLFRQISDDRLAQYAYLIGCQKTGEALIIDPQRDIDRYIALAEAEDLKIVAATETHIHADFVSGSREFAARGVKVYLSDEGDKDWKYQWASEYNTTLLKHRDTFQIGNIEIKALHTPGHTPEHIAFMITDLGGGANKPMGIASGDFVFVGDVGRPDLLESAAGVAGAQEPSARRLYASLQEFMKMPDYLQLWPGHGAGSACGKALGAVPESTVGYEKMFNASIDAVRQGEDHFVGSILEGQPEPPIYFAQMKKWNKVGPPLLKKMPDPVELDSSAVRDMVAHNSTVFVDTRLDRSAFMKQHIPGSLYAPFDKTFPTVAGSYVKDTDNVCLIVDRTNLDEAVRNLIRIGRDNVVAFATFDALNEYFKSGGPSQSTSEIDMKDLDLHTNDGTVVLDVRRKSEHDPESVPGSINVAHTRLASRMSEIPKDKKLLVHCRTGARSAVATAMLERNGYDVVYVNGMFSDWQIAHGETAVA
ncbi:MAG: MBL fold metallo-hydrolase [Rhodothermales bacterium]|nr:MBL fold metallo-hydrolase [Rhodothermales bacterium]